MKNNETNRIAFWVFAFLLVILFESMFFHNGSIITVLFGSVLIYFSLKKHSKWLFFSGLVFIIIALFTLWSLRLLFLLLLLNILVKLWKGVPSHEIMRPLKEFPQETPNGIWKNKLFSVQTSPFTSYEWEDLHIQGFFANLQIDVTDTILPKGTSLISVRQAFGKITIELPYEIPVRVHYHTLFGVAKLFDLPTKRLVNETIHMKDGYHEQIGIQPELIITLSTWIGDVEVIRK